MAYKPGKRREEELKVDENYTKLGKVFRALLCVAGAAAFVTVIAVTHQSRAGAMEPSLPWATPWPNPANAISLSNVKEPLETVDGITITEVQTEIRTLANIMESREQELEMVQEPMEDMYRWRDYYKEQGNTEEVDLLNKRIEEAEQRITELTAEIHSYGGELIDYKNMESRILDGPGARIIENPLDKASEGTDGSSTDETVVEPEAVGEEAAEPEAGLVEAAEVEATG